MNGMISAFRGTRRRRSTNHLIVVVNGVEKRDKAQGLVGKSVVWTAPGKDKTQIKGKVASAHGNSGALRVIFERGMPGQSLGSEVKIE